YCSRQEAEVAMPSEKKQLPEGCGYQGYEFGAGSYPDSMCCGGRLYDADDCDGKGSLYEPTEEITCPMGREQDGIAYWAEQRSVFDGEMQNHHWHEACLPFARLVNSGEYEWEFDPFINEHLEPESGGAKP